MKKFENEKEFVEQFSTNVRNGETEFAVNGKSFVCAGMEKNASKQAVYSIKVDGWTEAKKLTMPGLKRVLGVEYTATRNFAGGEKTGTSVRIKTGDEIIKTVEVAVDRIKTAAAVLTKAADKYGLTAAELVTMDQAALFAAIKTRLFEERDRAAAEKAAQEKKAAEQKAAKVDAVAALTAQLQAALSARDLAKVAELSVAIKAATK